MLWRLICIYTLRVDPSGRAGYLLEELDGGCWVVHRDGNPVKKLFSLPSYRCFWVVRELARTQPAAFAAFVRASDKTAAYEGLCAPLLAIRNSEENNPCRHLCGRGAKKSEVCVRGSHILGRLGDLGGAAANEMDKHFQYFLHHPDDKTRINAFGVFRKGGLFGEAFKQAYGVYFELGSDVPDPFCDFVDSLL